MKNPYKLTISKFSTHYIICQLFGSDHKILDVGCNTGYLGSISNNTNTFYGIDISKENIKVAKKRYIQAIQYNLNILKELPWNTKFDVIVFADVLEHVNDPDASLQFFVNHYLKKGGKVVISLPNVANWFIRLQLLFGNFHYTDAGILDRTHKHFYTFISARDFVCRNRLQVLKEFSGSSIFGYVLLILPFLRGLLSTGIILYCERS